MFRSFFLVTTALLTVATVASAGSTGSSLLSPKAAGGASGPTLRPAVTSNPCASYGAGFARVDGSSTCVKVGGAVRVETGTRR